MNLAGNRVAWLLGVCVGVVLSVGWSVKSLAAEPDGLSIASTAVPIGNQAGEAQAPAEAEVPAFDWLDDAYDTDPSWAPVGQEGGRSSVCCRQGTDGCSCRCPRCSHAPRFYLAGVVGASFATLTSAGSPSATDALFTTGGIAGLHVRMLETDWRVEVEGRVRNPIMDTLTLADDISTATLGARGVWSTTVNLWRDFLVTDCLSTYVGAGLGGGGFQFGVNQQFPDTDVTVAGTGTMGGFAWQAGCGMAYALNDWITLDLGYRFFEIAAGRVTADVSQGGVPVGTDTFDSGFSASELFFAFRIEQPFRGWR